MINSRFRRHIVLPSGKTARVYPEIATAEELIRLIASRGIPDAMEILEMYGVSIGVINGQLCIDSDEIPITAEFVDTIRHLGGIEHMAILRQQDQQDAGISRYNLPIRIFYANLLKMGITLRVVDGQLKVGGRKDLVTPPLRDEIKRRASHLVDLLEVAPPEEMASCFDRLLTQKELVAALNTAEFLGVKVDSLPVNGGWLLTMAKTK